MEMILMFGAVNQIYHEIEQELNAVHSEMSQLQGIFMGIGELV